jgi:hypothetical protein
MNASHTRYAHMRQALDTPTQVSQGDRPTGNRGQLLTTSAEGQERLQNGAWPDIRVWVYKPDRPRDALPRHASLGNAELPERPRDEGVPRDARAPGLRSMVCQETKQRQRRGPYAPERLHRQRHEGEAEDTCQ